MIIVPIQDDYVQTLSVLLGGQSCQITLHKRSSGMYCDLSVSDVAILYGVLCMNLTKIVRDSYLGFVGDLLFYDTEGVDDPTYPGLGTRYLLLYIEDGEY